MIFQPKRVLCISPHTDDAEVSSGGTISRFLREGAEVHVVVLSRAAAPEEESPWDECTRSLVSLGINPKRIRFFHFPLRHLLTARQEILDIFIELKRQINPDLVLLPSMNDIHQDHQAVAREGLRAFKDRTVLGYEYPWNHLVFHTTCFLSFNEHDLQAKIQAISEYKSQKKDYLEPEIIRAWALTRGVAVGTKYAESFEVMRLVV